MSDSLEDALAFYARAAPATTTRPPFRFLDAYEREDRDTFCGRDTEIEDLRTRFHRSRLLVVYGESGAGKTSLLQCGLASAIRDEDAELHFVRCNLDPIAAIRTALDGGGDTSIADLLDARARAASRTVALIFDQFEELFLFQPEEVRDRLLAELRTAIDRRLDIRFVFCLREEFLSHMTAVEEVLPDVFEQRFWLRRMRARDARAAIELPCQRAQITIEDGVPELILDRLRDARSEVDLPYLQIVLDRLYRSARARGAPLRIGHDDVAALGTMEGVLSSFLEERIAELTHRDLGRAILKTFVSAARTRKAVDAASLLRVAARVTERATPSWPPRAAEAKAPDASAETLRQLVAARILRQDHADAPFELRHDSLAEAIARWLTPLEEEDLKLRAIIESRYAEFMVTGDLIHDRALLDRIQPRLGRLDLASEVIAFLNRSMSRTDAARDRRRAAVWAVLALALVGLVVWLIVSALRTPEPKVVRLGREELAEILDVDDVRVETTSLMTLGDDPARFATDVPSYFGDRGVRMGPQPPGLRDGFVLYVVHHAIDRVLVRRDADGWISYELFFWGDDQLNASSRKPAQAAAALVDHSLSALSLRRLHASWDLILDDLTHRAAFGQVAWKGASMVIGGPACTVDSGDRPAVDTCNRAAFQLFLLALDRAWPYASLDEWQRHLDQQLHPHCEGGCQNHTRLLAAEPENQDVVQGNIAIYSGFNRDRALGSCRSQCESGLVDGACLAAARTLVAAEPCAGASSGRVPLNPLTESEWRDAALEEQEEGGLVIDLPAGLTSDVRDDRVAWSFATDPLAHPRFETAIAPVRRFPAGKRQAIAAIAALQGVDVDILVSLGASQANDQKPGRFVLVTKSSTYVTVDVLVAAGNKTLWCSGEVSGPSPPDDETEDWLLGICSRVRMVDP